MRELGKKSLGISKMLVIIVIAALVIVSAVVGAYWWLFLRPIPKERTIIYCVAPFEVPKDQDVTIVGQISPAVATKEITLTFTKPGSTFNETATSDSDGFFACKYTVDVEGEWNVVARWPGSHEYERATSNLATFTVSPPLEPGKSAISCVTLLPRGVDAGKNVTVMGWIYPAEAGAPVTLNFTDPDGSTSTEQVSSDADGSFKYTYATTDSDVKGRWNVTASWLGTTTLDGATSNLATFTTFLPQPIKIGVFRNMLIQGKGMEEAAKMAMEEINDAGGVLGRRIVLVFGDEGTDPATGTAEMERIITVEGVDFVVGGFRTEILFPAREIAMDHKKILITTGAATNELYNCFGSLLKKPTGESYFPCHKCLYCDEKDNTTRYKYMFRVMPPNSTLLFLRTLIPYIKFHLVPNVLGGTPESKLKVAAVIEDLTWADTVANVWRDLFPVVFSTPEGLTMDPVYLARPSNTETDFSGILTTIKDKGAKLILHAFSGEAGMAYIRQWAEMKIPAVAIGVNVLSQNNEMWPDTGGKCEYEAFLSSPPRVPMTPGLIPWWDRYVERWGHDPLYTSLGTYDALYTLKFGMEAAGTTDRDAVVAALEPSERMTLMGRAKFTKYHDVFIRDSYPMTEHPDWVAPLIVQWRSPGRRAVIFPFNRTFTEDYVLPPWVTL